MSAPPPPHKGIPPPTIGKGLWLGEKDRTNRGMKITQSACGLRRAALTGDFDGYWMMYHTVHVVCMLQRKGGSHLVGKRSRTCFTPQPALKAKGTGDGLSRLEQDSRSAPPPFSLTLASKASLIRFFRAELLRYQTHRVPCSLISSAKPQLLPTQPTYATNPAADCDKHYYYYHC